MDSDNAESASQRKATASDIEVHPKVPDAESPAEAFNIKPPNKASNSAPLPEDSNIESPVDGTNAKPSAVAVNVEPPVEDTNVEAHAKDSNIKPSDRASNIESPGDGTDAKPSAVALNVEPPVEDTNVEAHAKDSNIKPSDEFQVKTSNIEPAKISIVEAPHKASRVKLATPTQPVGNSSAHESPLSMLSPSNISSWAKTLKFPQPVPPPQENSQTGSTGMSSFARFTTELGMRLPSISPVAEKSAEGTSTTNSTGVLESLTKGLVDSSRSAVKAVQVKARHIVSQNKRRYQEGEFDLDMTYITENIIAMGFPAGDISSGIFGYLEGFYRNHMEEVIKFFETHHKGKYKVYNLCSERLYNAALFQGKVACFPFDDHNCPPIQLIASFCQSAVSWLKEDILNVVVVHCKAGMGRTGLMICSLLLFLKFFPTAEEAIDYYNQKRCLDGKALVLPSQIRYVKYFERILTYFHGEIQPARRCMLRGFRLLRCPYWIRPSITISNHSGIIFSTKKHKKTKDLMPEDFWIKSPKKGIVVFALPGQPGLTELAGDFKVTFHDRQGDFYCWLNTTMTENRKILNGSDLDGFDKRKVPSPGFQVEMVMIEYDGTLLTKAKADSSDKRQDCSTDCASVPTSGATTGSDKSKVTDNEDNDNVFSDSDGEEVDTSRNRQANAASGRESAPQVLVSNSMTENVLQRSGQLALRIEEPKLKDVFKEPTTDAALKPAPPLPVPNLDSVGTSDIKSMAADASVFSFRDDEDYESE